MIWEILVEANVVHRSQPPPEAPPRKRPILRIVREDDK
jgi:hypothetical protein